MNTVNLLPKTLQSLLFNKMMPRFPPLPLFYWIHTVVAIDYIYGHKSLSGLNSNLFLLNQVIFADKCRKYKFLRQRQFGPVIRQ